MMALHLRAFARSGPAVEFVLQLVVGSLRFVGHGRFNCSPRHLGGCRGGVPASQWRRGTATTAAAAHPERSRRDGGATSMLQDRKSTRLNSSHLGISYAVFCLK